jgi:hypothetical protein
MSMANSSVEIQFSLHASRLPRGSSDPTRTGDGRLPRVTQVMALAIQFQDMILRGEAKNYADLARLGCLTRERMSQIMELVWLAPTIQQEILEFPATGSRFPISEVAARKISDFLSWREQLIEWARIKRIQNPA